MTETRVLTGADIAPVIDDLARLRIAVFREWPYLYDGSMEYERAYLGTFAGSEGAVVVAAFDGSRMVGAATGSTLAAHADDFAAALDGTEHSVDEMFYHAESVLLPEYRGRGLGHEFFDGREAHARALNLPKACFCAVVRDPDHPLRPDGYRPLDPFWRRRGYAPIPGAIAHFDWTDVGEGAPSRHPLQMWMRPLST